MPISTLKFTSSIWDLPPPPNAFSLNLTFSIYKWGCSDFLSHEDHMRGISAPISTWLVRAHACLLSLNLNPLTSWIYFNFVESSVVQQVIIWEMANQNVSYFFFFLLVLGYWPACFSPQELWYYALLKYMNGWHRVITGSPVCGLQQAGHAAAFLSLSKQLWVRSASTRAFFSFDFQHLLLTFNLPLHVGVCLF